MRIAMIGTGYVGLVSGACLAGAKLALSNIGYPRPGILQSMISGTDAYFICTGRGFRL
jgi:hypothetical protein